MEGRASIEGVSGEAEGTSADHVADASDVASMTRDVVRRLQDAWHGNAHAREPPAGLLGRKKTCRGLVARALRVADTAYLPL